MIKVKYINDNKESIYVQSCTTTQEALKVDYYIWREIHRECVFEYRGHFTIICQEEDFTYNSKYLEDWIENIDDLADKCLKLR